VLAGSGAAYTGGSLFFPLLTLVLLNTRSARSWFARRTW